ncbi:MAG: hypothetical protein U1F43_14305 [Myxococcota bacterium]
MVQRINTASELRTAWRSIVSLLSRDLAFAARLARDPIGALREHGYDVTDEAALVLRRALP